jgi:hypothetical protein
MADPTPGAPRSDGLAQVIQEMPLLAADAPPPEA